MNDLPQVYEKGRLDEMYAQLGLPDDTIKLLHDYFAAFGEFYRIISLHDAFSVIKRHNGDLISRDAFIAFSEIVRHEDRHFYYVLGADELYDNIKVSEIMDREIVFESLLDFDLYYDISDSQRGKPMYIPEKEELLKYADDMYFEHNPQTKALCDFFQNEMGMDSVEAGDMAGECVLCITCAVIPKDNPVDDVLDDFERMKVKFTKLQKYEFVKLVCDLANNTRHPCNRGFTPNELAERMGIGERKTVTGISASDSAEQFDPSEIGLMEVVQNSSIAGIKIGRNEPCPCGSGKKYKKCCGR